MRILLAVLRYLPAVGGSIRVVQLLAEGLATRGHDVTVVTQSEPNCPPNEVIERVNVIRIPMRRVAGFRVPRGYLRTLRAIDADLFQLHGNRIWCADYYFPFARTFSWPQVIAPYNFYHYWMRRGFVRWLYYERYLPGRLRAFDAYVALTDSERDQVLGWKYPSDRLRVIPCGIDLSEFSKPEVDREKTRASWGLSSPRVALYTGGMYDNKRVDRLVRAVALTRGEWGLVVTGPDIPGSPYDRASCQRLADQLSAPVRFLGPVPRSEVLAAYASADAYVQGSAFEGFGLSLLEAMAAGLPFVAFDAGAARQLSLDGGGYLVTSEAEMAARLRVVPTLGEDMRQEGLRAVREYSADRMVDRHLQLYRKIARTSP